MVNKLQFLRSLTPGNSPAGLSVGEIAFNLSDKKLFIGNGSDTITRLNGSTESVALGTGYFESDLTTLSANAYTDQKIADLIDSAPALLNTLNELAAAIGDDANFVTTVTNAVATVQSNLDAEAARAIAAEGTLTSNLAAEVARATAAEAALQTAIDDEEARALAAEAALQSSINTEAAARTAADATLQSNINAEAAARTSAVSTLQSNINAEIAARTSADSALDARLSRAEDSLATLEVVVHENNSSYIGVDEPPVQDPDHREGWYFNSDGTATAEWKLINTSTSNVAVEASAHYVVMALDSLVELPVFDVLTKTTGSNDASPGNYHSRLRYTVNTAGLEIGKKYLFHFGNDPLVHPELTHVALTFQAGSSEVANYFAGEFVDNIRLSASGLADECKFLLTVAGFGAINAAPVESVFEIRKATVADLEAEEARAIAAEAAIQAAAEAAVASEEARALAAEAALSARVSAIEDGIDLGTF